MGQWILSFFSFFILAFHPSWLFHLHPLLSFSLPIKLTSLFFFFDPFFTSYYNEFVRCLDTIFEQSTDYCPKESYEYFREMTGKFRSSTIDMLCGSKYHRASEKCDVVVGPTINGRDILVKYLIGVFANRPEVDIRRITGKNPIFPWAMSRSEYSTSRIE